jgi:hypothetical protein|tara:strand:- start:290 stop:976 length:687 start_codon:yes stop_codon:yes gene_type:complete
MARQPFRRTKSDGTIDDGTGGGGVAGFKTVDLDASYDHSFHKSYGAFGVDGQSTGYTMNFFISNNNFYAYPFLMPKDGTLESITMQVSTAGDSGDEIAVAIYPSDANGDPGGESAILRKTDVDVSSTGYKTVTSISSPTVTGGDIYWFALTPKFGTFPGTCKMKTSIGGIPNLSGRIVGGSSNTTPFSGVSRWGTFSGDPPASIGATDFQYKSGMPTGRYILFTLTYA